MDNCKKCNRTIFGSITTHNQKGELITIPDFVWGKGNDKFCSYCAITCFFIDGEMYDGFGEIKKPKKEKKK